MSKTLLITGASSGIGLATALAAARAGFQTFAGVRDTASAQRRLSELIEAEAEAGAAAEAGVGGPAGLETGRSRANERAGLAGRDDAASIEFVSLDITDARSISDCLAVVLERSGRLDALVNNAGVAGSNSPLELADLADLRATMEVNFFGTIAISQAAMPHLRATQGRLVTLSSVRGVIGQPFNEAYSASKFAIEGFMEAVAPVAARAGVSVSLVQPAAVLGTEFVANSSGPDPAELLAMAGAYEPAFRAYRDWVPIGAVKGAQRAAEVAQTVLQALSMDDPPLRIQTSQHARDYVACQLTDPSGARVQAMTRSWVSKSGVSAIVGV
jgi:NAD(P)-dependent dehydrogenase (short-subunit alcohol dehydrogenase family)